MRNGWCRSFVLFVVGAAAAVMFVAPAQAQGCQNPPEPTTLCNGVPCNPDLSECTAGGHKLTLVSYAPAPSSLVGGGTYTYQICSPVAGTCVGAPRNGESCLENDFCKQKGQETNPLAVCNRECAVDDFHELSHLDVDFPSLGTCLSETNFVGGTCACVGGPSMTCGVDSAVVLGDGSCYCSTSTVAKCDNTSMGPGDCIEMVLTISGETNVVGLGTVVVVDKESGDCNETCLGGPVCVPPEDCENQVDDDCDGLTDCEDPDCDTHPSCGNDGGECLTRTLGFWGTHPWITNNYAPVTVCGHSVGCSGADDGMSNPSCESGHCDDVMEALGSNGGELKNGAAYISLLKQLAAAKLNLSATASLVDGGLCSGFTYGGKTIQAWIEACEATNLCNGSQSKISSSGCIEALDAFNNSQDTGFDQPPAPFDRPPLDDHGVISGADPSNFTAAHNNKVVIGKNVPGGTNCN